MNIWTSLDKVAQDLRYAIRTLRKSPGFTTVAVLSLALGIGANTSVFSLLDAVLLKSIPVKNPGQLRILTWVRNGDPTVVKSHSGYTIQDHKGRSVDGSFSYPAFQTFQTLPEFSGVVAYAQNQFTVTAGGTTGLAHGHYVSGNYFTGLGAQPILGRPILADDDAPGKPRVAVLTHLYWTQRFGADPGIVGQSVRLNRETVTIVGVMQPAFQGLEPGRAVDLFVPMSMVPETAVWYTLADPGNWWVQVFGRLKPGISDQAASQAVQAALTHQIEAYAGPNNKAVQVVLQPGAQGVAMLRSNAKTSLYILAVVAALVLLIACINLANLLLARYIARAKEIAIRMSIGAGRARLIRQMLTESLFLAAIGAAAGLLLARPMLRLLINFLSGTSTLGLDARLDTRALLFTFSIAVLTALIFGTMPAWRATAVNLRPRAVFGRYLVAFQIALSLLLVVGTSLFLRTLVGLASVDLGFQPDNLLTFQTDPGRSGYQPAEAANLYRRLETRLASIPGVEAVGMSHLALIGGVATNGPVRLPGDEKGKPTYFLNISDSFLSTMRIPVVMGRDLNQADFDRPMRSAVVNELFVKKYLPDVNPIGQIFYPPSFRKTEHLEPFTIVGVAKDAHYRGVRSDVPPTAYLPFAFRASGDTTMVFMMRTKVAPLSIVSSVRQAVNSVDVNLPVAEVRTERDQIDRSLGSERLFAALVTVFGAIALILAAVGLYGVMAFSVTRRTSEIGVRMALGAKRIDVQWLVLRQSLIMTLIGLAVGIAAALMLIKLIAKLLYGIKPADPLSIISAVAAMLAVAALAAWIPARRAARVNPISALRYE